MARNPNIHSLRDWDGGPSESTNNTRPSNPSQQGFRSFQPGPGGTIIYGQPESGPGVSLVQAPSSEPMPTIGERIMPRFNVRTFTFVVSVLDLIIFVVTLIVGGAKFDGAFVKGNSMGGPSSYTFYYMGGKWEAAIRAGHVWRLLTPIVLHAGVLHILGNLFFQLRYGFSLEARWGIRRFAAVYIVGGIGASLFSAICDPRTISVGASGALFGMTGADLAYLAINWNDVPDNRQELCMMVCMIVITMLMGISQSVDNYAHLGGMLTGAIIAGWLLEQATQRTPEKMKAITWGSVIASVIWAILLVCLLWARDPCPTCPVSISYSS